MKCSHPQRRYREKNGTRYPYEHSCGQCLACKSKLRSQWQLRILLESFDHETSSFITLTYADENLPGVKDNQPLYGVSKYDIQQFLRRLKRQTGREYRYYAAAEYGSKTGRPHVHVILFGHNYLDRDEIEKAWSKNGELIGNIQCDELNPARASYIAKYTIKYINGNRTEPDGRPSEFAIQSRRPKGLGYTYVAKICASVERGSKNLGITPRDFIRNKLKSIRIGGTRMSISPYLKQKIEAYFSEKELKNLSSEEREIIENHREKQKIAESQGKILYNKGIRELEIINDKKLSERIVRRQSKAKSL